MFENAKISQPIVYYTVEKTGVCALTKSVVKVKSSRWCPLNETHVFGHIQITQKSQWISPNIRISGLNKTFCFE